ncbi:molybdopterin-binding protein [Nostocaceae cyanobacterium CENA369]|uniref:Molybdopterin-binding protein n=1 Tax=Dendronalium phyllosphericum CENA369 TaxID=1725256 RepID=A0A8J7LFQ1_9NOST|nr:molybdopterin-binding protein [Dendronalium phyllosphericum]MBH8576247.1 molybdopterin-binding protein [Dendronalium phyllosphericum CENA369]
MPRKEQGWVTFQTSEEERKILEEFCEQFQRTKTEILRELVRSLARNSLPVSLTTQIAEMENAYTQKPEIENGIQKKPLKVSSRNVLKGVVKRIVKDSVNSEVTLEIVQKVELTSIITRVSADELDLSEGKEAYAVIKSNDIVIAME